MVLAQLFVCRVDVVIKEDIVSCGLCSDTSKSILPQGKKQRTLKGEFCKKLLLKGELIYKDITVISYARTTSLHGKKQSENHKLAL